MNVEFGKVMQTLLHSAILETALRTLLIYTITLTLVRLGSARAMGRATVMDAVVAIMLGSIMTDGIEGGVSLGPILVAGGVLMGMHMLLAIFAYRTDWLGPLVKGG